MAIIQESESREKSLQTQNGQFWLKIEDLLSNIAALFGEN